MAKRKRLSPIDTVRAETVLPGTSRDETAKPALSGRAPIAGVAAEAAARAALDEMDASLTAARESGRMVVEVPLDAIVYDYIPRDRMVTNPEEDTALTASIQQRGQQVPAEAVRLPDGRFGLISGWRRCQVLKALHVQTGEERFSKALVLLRQPDHTAEAMLAMVEENEIRSNLSYFERAHVVVKSVDQGVFETDREALRGLFGAATRPRRSKIGAFVPIVRALDGLLRYPEALTERTGLALSKALRDDAGLVTRLRAALRAPGVATAAQEQEAIKALLKTRKPPQSPVSTRSAPGKQTEVQIPGLEIKRQRNGSLVLSGPRLDDALQQDLVVWLQTRIAP